MSPTCSGTVLSLPKELPMRAFVGNTGQGMTDPNEVFVPILQTIAIETGPTSAALP